MIIIKDERRMVSDLVDAIIELIEAPRHEYPEQAKKVANVLQMHGVLADDAAASAFTLKLLSAAVTT